MILIADSGSTTTGWCLLPEQREEIRFETAGIHPFQQQPEEIQTSLEGSMPEFLRESPPSTIHFYGTGCWYPAQQEQVRKGLELYFGPVEILVYPDLLGAARALFADRPGLAVILGTGSSVCLYDGNQISGSVKSLGYVLGDPCSGAWLGRELLRHFLEESLPTDLSGEFRAIFKPDPQNILEQVYSRPFPNRYLASYVPFLAERQSDPFVQRLLEEGLDQLRRSPSVADRYEGDPHQSLRRVV